jgi:hypothetical protein
MPDTEKRGEGAERLLWGAGRSRPGSLAAFIDANRNIPARVKKRRLIGKIYIKQVEIPNLFVVKKKSAYPMKSYFSKYLAICSFNIAR